MRKGFLKGILAATLAAGIITSSYIPVFADTKELYERNGSGYNVYTMTTSVGPSDQAKKLNVLGFNKKSYTTGSITITKSQSETFTASSTISSEYNAGFVKVGTQLSVATSATYSVSAGTTITIQSSAPNGIYYAYIATPRRKVAYEVRGCSINHTGWYTKYKKTLEYAPMLGYEYLEVKRSS